MEVLGPVIPLGKPGVRCDGFGRLCRLGFGRLLRGGRLQRSRCRRPGGARGNVGPEQIVSGHRHSDGGERLDAGFEQFLLLFGVAETRIRLTGRPGGHTDPLVEVEPVQGRGHFHQKTELVAVADRFFPPPHGFRHVTGTVVKHRQGGFGHDRRPDHVLVRGETGVGYRMVDDLGGRSAVGLFPPAVGRERHRFVCRRYPLGKPAGLGPDHRQPRIDHRWVQPRLFGDGKRLDEHFFGLRKLLCLAVGPSEQLQNPEPHRRISGHLGIGKPFFQFDDRRIRVAVHQERNPFSVIFRCGSGAGASGDNRRQKQPQGPPPQPLLDHGRIL